MRNIFLLTLIYLFSSTCLQSQVRLDNWQTYSALTDIYEVDVDKNNVIWAATTGGLFSYDLESKVLTPYSNIDALLSLDITSVLCSESGEVYAGSSDGVIHILDNNKKWTYLTDIRAAGLPNSSINKMLFYNGNLYAVGGFGISTVDIENHVFIESASRFSSLPPNTEVRDIVIKNDSIYLATSSGIVAASASTSFVDPNSWTVYTTPEQDYNSFVEIETFNDKIYAVTEDRLYIIEDGNLVIEAEVQYGIVGLEASSNNLYYSGLFNIKTGDKTISFPREEVISGIKILDEEQGTFVVLLKKSGFGIAKQDEMETVIPNSPNSNLYSSTDVDPQGRLWIATSNGGGTGVNLFDGETWTHFTNKIEDLTSNDFFKIYSASNGKTIGSTWGDGFFIFEPDGSFKRYDEQNSPMRGISTSPKYTLAGCAQYDFSGNLWVVNYGENSEGPVLLSMLPDGTMHSFPNRVNSTARHYVPMTIDFAGTKWLGATEKFNSGLYYFNEHGSLEDLSDDIFGTYTTSTLNNLPSNTITDLVTDKQGKIWVGTSEGICQILNPSAVLSDAKPIVVFSDLIGNAQVYDIEIDAIDNKWVATSSGLWVLNNDGTEVLAIINKRNSPLTTNTINSVTLDDASGRVFIGTKEGLFTAYSLSVEPEENHNISCYPQPFKPRRDSEVVIEGLAGNSDVRILTTNGQLVAEIQTAGAKTIWNGKDINGNYVQTGVYLIVASSETTGSSAVHKIAIINE